MDMDELAWEQADNQSDEWERSLHKAAVYREVANFINKHRLGKPVELHRPIKGGYNIFYRLEYEDGSSAALRIPCPGMRHGCLLSFNISSIPPSHFLVSY